MPLPASALFAWHMQPSAFLRQLPPWQRLTIRSSGNPADIGSRVKIELRPYLWPFSIRWILEITECKIGEYFIDQQVRGPFRFWRHIHRTLSEGEQSVLSDEIEWSTFNIARSRARAEIEKVFHWRHERLHADLYAYSNEKGSTKMRILVTGSSGLIGKNLVSFLRAGGHEVLRLVRKPTREKDALVWNPEKGAFTLEDFEDFTAVIHLAGDNLNSQRWTSKHKKKIFQSRCRDTWLLAHALSRLKNPPQVFISSSAIGYYGDRGNQTLTEESEAGRGFLADLCQQWEKASAILQTRGTRIVHTRLGMVLSPEGGALKKLLPFYRWGLGAVLGKGEQWVSWIAADDVVYALHHILLTPELQGPVNLTAPQNLTNRDFSKSLALACKSQLFLRLPAPFVRIFFGEIADALLLSSERVFPQKLTNSGFLFTCPKIDLALKYI